MVISCHCRICPISVCTHFVECPCQAGAQQGIVKLHLYQHGIHGGGQSFQFQRFVLLRKHQPSLCHAPVWKVQTIGVMVHLRIFVFISDLFGIYNQFPFFPADAWCRAVYHVPDLQHEVVEVVRFSSVELEADHAAVVFYQLVHQGGVCPLAVEPFIADDNQDIGFIRTFVELLHSDPKAGPAAESSVCRLQLLGITCFGGKEIKQLHVVGSQFADGVFPVVRFVEGKHGTEPERKAVVIHQLRLQSLDGIHHGWKPLDGVLFSFQDKHEVYFLQVLLYLVFESPVIDWIAVDIQHIAFPFIDDRHRKPGFEAEARVIVPVGQYRAVADSRLAGRKLQFPLQVVG